MTDQIGARLPKPKLRGVLHQAAFVIAVVIAPLLIVGADRGRPRLAAAVFAGSVVVCFGASALYHRVTWTPRVRLWMRRVDHAGIYLLIAGTYTPVSLLVLRGAWRPVVLTVVWTGAAAAIILRLVWVTAPEVARRGDRDRAWLAGGRCAPAADRPSEPGCGRPARCRRPP